MSSPSAGFLVSALLIVRIRQSLEEAERAPSRGHWGDLADGFSFALRSKSLLTIIVAWSIAVLATAGVNVAEIVLAKSVFDAGDFGYGLLETSVGIIPGAGGTQRMARLLGSAKALDLVLHGTVMTPREAHALGLAHRLLPAASFTAGVAEFARGLAARAPLALQAAKQAIRQGVERPMDEALRIEQQAFARTLRTEDARGAMRAYVDGRPFGFQGR